MSDATQLVVPLWQAVSVCGGIMTSVVLVVVWTLTTFEKRADAIARAQEQNLRIGNMESSLIHVSRDVSYIRGRVEKIGNA